MKFSVILMLGMVHGIRTMEVPVANTVGLLNGSIPAGTPEIPPTEDLVKVMDVRQSWKSTEKQLKHIVGKVLKQAMPTVMREVYTRNVSTQCLGRLLQLTKGLKNAKLWAFQMLDASGRFPVGFLSGTLVSFGNYEQCIGIDVMEKSSRIQGQYCMVDILPPIPEWRNFLSIYFTVPELKNISAPDTVITFLTSFIHNLNMLTIRNGFCVPANCSVEDIHKLVQIIPEKLDINWKFTVKKCEVKEETKFTPPQVFVLCIMGGVILLVLIGTVVNQCSSGDTAGEKTIRGTILQILGCFSVLRNGRMISNFVPPHEEYQFLYGILFICIYWTLTSHSIVYMNFDIVANFVGALDLGKTIFLQVMYNRIIPLQTLLFIWAFTTTYKIMKSPEKNLCIWKYLLKAYWRYTPIYVLVMSFILLAPVLGSGPSWTSHLIPMYEKCRSGWWQNLLYFNNYLNPENSCLEHTWLLAVAAQLHLMGIIILVPLKLRPNIGLMLIFVISAASLVAVALTHTYYNLPPNEMIAFLHFRDRFFYTEHSHQRVYSHVCLYCAGIFSGYFVAVKPNLKIPPIISLILWITCAAAGAVTLCLIQHWNTGIVPSPLYSACYAAFSKLAWAAFLSWVSIFCVVYQSGVIYDFLSWRPFAFFGRLSFIAYLIHPAAIQVITSYRRTHLSVSLFDIFYNILVMAICTYLLSYVLYLFLEAPLWHMTNLVRKSCGKRILDPSPRSDNSSVTFCEELTVAEKPQKINQAKALDDGKLPLNSRGKNKY